MDVSRVFEVSKSKRTSQGSVQLRKFTRRRPARVCAPPACVPAPHAPTAHMTPASRATTPMPKSRPSLALMQLSIARLDEIVIEPLAS